ncbi:MAG: glycosyl transferase family 1 [Candidatus Syntrophoarchaeum butanivorans]|uniref:Glycosyl transferase family 1 n=1 Tax=Candidatus Syntropharchaeum butanivorans TaxID=1839936 RepID=A0A1F2P7B0_9EURY|nr:MAG: glycosyl transferase family 1 [Candidatus Syntrophoarchaeum butanivorans]
MHVLIVHPAMYVYGGAEIVIVKLANYLSEKGIKNTLLTTSIIPEIQKDLQGTETIIPKKQPKRGFMTLLSHIHEALTLRKYILENINDFDLINVHNFPSELSILSCPKPVVWMCNEPPEMYLGSESRYQSVSFLLKIANRFFLMLERFVVRRYIERVVVADEFNARRFERIYGIKPDIINYGVDYEFFSRGDGKSARDRFNLHNDFVLIQVGMLTPLKNQMESIKTVEALKEKIPNLKLVLAGLADGEYAELLRSYVCRKGLDSCVVFTGQLSQDEIRDLYHASDVALFPIKSQGGWLSPFEALSAGLPIVVSTSMTASSIIEREALGIVTDDFTQAVLEIYTEQERYQEMAKAGGEWVYENLSWNRFCEKMVKIFEEVM